MPSFGGSDTPGPWKKKIGGDQLPGGKHLPGASPKFQRMYEHIKSSYIKEGVDEKTAKERAAATTNMHRTMQGDTKKSKKK